MTKLQQSQKPRGLNMLAQATAVAMLGAVIGSGATAFTYHALLGGAEKIEKFEKIEQVALTVEHSRIVNDEVLAVLKQIEAKLDEAPKAVAPTMPPLPSMPAQHQIDAAIDGLFESLGDEDAAPKPAQVDTQAGAASNVQGSNVSEGDGIKKNASGEAGAVQKGNE